jgi:DHA1 family multidrug resistance protein-like MFS transporter
MEPWRKNLYVLWGTQFLAMAGMNLVVPFLPFFIRSLGVEDHDELARWSGLVFAGPFVLSFLATPIWGAMGDRYGRKIMTVRAIFGLAISQLLIGFSQDVYQLFFFRIVQGAISGFIASALALVSTNTPKEKSGYAIGVLQSSTAAGMVLGPFLGGVLADLFGYRAIFFITASLCTISGVCIVLFVREFNKVGSESKAHSVVDNYLLMFRDRRLRIISIALVVGQISVLMIEPVFALFVEGLTSDTRYLSTVAGAVFSISGLFMVISAPWWGKRNDRTGHKKTLYITFCAAGLCYAGHLVVTDLLQLAALRGVLGFFRGAILPTLYSLTSVYAPAERRGGMMAIASSMTLFGNLLGPTAGGLVAGAFGVRASFLANSLLLIGTGALIWKYLQESGPERPAVTPDPSPRHMQPAETDTEIP